MTVVLTIGKERVRIQVVQTAGKFVVHSLFKNLSLYNKVSQNNEVWRKIANNQRTTSNFNAIRPCLASVTGLREHALIFLMTSVSGW